MKLTPESIEESGYILLDRLDHKELIPFVRFYLNKRTTISIFYTLCNLLIAGSIGFYFWLSYSADIIDIGSAITYFSYGLALAFGLLPIHEYIHVLAYRSQGALETSYDVNWKKFYFMAVANHFVANRREFQIVALAPFVIISTVLSILLFFTNPFWTFTILGMLLTHTAFSSGDFGLLSYFEFHHDKDMVTYDDREQKLSYFYGKSK
jgi:hypothetical protein